MLCDQNIFSRMRDLRRDPVIISFASKILSLPHKTRWDHVRLSWASLNVSVKNDILSHFWRELRFLRKGIYRFYLINAVVAVYLLLLYNFMNLRRNKVIYWNYSPNYINNSHIVQFSWLFQKLLLFRQFGNRGGDLSVLLL